MVTQNVFFFFYRKTALLSILDYSVTTYSESGSSSNSIRIYMFIYHYRSLFYTHVARPNLVKAVLSNLYDYVNLKSSCLLMLGNHNISCLKRDPISTSATYTLTQFGDDALDLHTAAVPVNCSALIDKQKSSIFGKILLTSLFLITSCIRLLLSFH